MRKPRAEIEDSRGLGQRAEVARVEIEQNWHMVVVLSVGCCLDQYLIVFVVSDLCGIVCCAVGWSSPSVVSQRVGKQ